MKQRINDTLAALTGYQLQRVAGSANGKAAVATKKGPQSKKKAGGGGEGKKQRDVAVNPIARGWDNYSKKRSGQTALGKQWNAHRKQGVDLPEGERLVPYLDRVVFDPFLGTVDVMVEIGPGGGRFTRVLLPKCKKLIAVDAAPTMLQRLEERYAAEGDKIEYVLGDGAGLPGIADASVDAVFSYAVFVHLQHWDIYHYLTEIERVLVPGGKALIQHSNTFSELGWNHFLHDLKKQVNRHKKRFGTFVVNSPEIMREFVERAGLECVDTITDVAKRDCITLIRKPA